MSIHTPIDELLIEKLRTHLRAEEYSARIQQWYLARARHLLDYCNGNALAIEAIRSRHITQFLRREYRLFCRRHRESPPFDKWRWRYTGAVYMLLRLVHGRWPVADLPATALEGFHQDIVQDYDSWLRDLRGLQAVTRAKRTKHAWQFLAWLGTHADEDSLSELSVREVDAYLKQCCVGLRRASIEDCTVCLRDFLRHLYRGGRTASDLSGTVIGPRIYEHEGIPSAPRAEEVHKVLKVTREDRSSVGLRDYAILMLLSTYKLRAAEIVKLRLEDIDWVRRETDARQRVKVPYGEGRASHTGPESCGGAREDALEALTGVRIGRVIERRKTSTSECQCYPIARRQYELTRHRERQPTPRRL